MNKRLKSVCIYIVYIYAFICAYEILHAYMTKIPEYIQHEDLHSNFYTHIKKVLVRLLHTFIYYIIIELIDYKLPLHKTEDSTEDLSAIHVDDISSPLEKWVFDNKALIVVYLYFVTQVSTLDPVLLLLVPFLQYKLLVYLYNKHRYYKTFVYPAIIGLCEAAYKIMLVTQLPKQLVNTNTIPKRIYNYLEQRGYTVNVMHIDGPKLNVGVTAVFDQITIFIMGDVMQNVTSNEFISILYHEIGHVVNNSHLFRLLVTKCTRVLLYIAEFIMIFNNSKMLRQSYYDSQVKNLVLLFVLMNITVLPLVISFTNYYSMIDEIEADRFSCKMHDKANLISGLIKLTVINDGFYSMSYPYALMHYDHPILDHRIKLIENFKE